MRSDTRTIIILQSLLDSSLFLTVYRHKSTLTFEDFEFDCRVNTFFLHEFRTENTELISSP